MTRKGLSNRAIAKELGVNEATIRNDRKVIAMPAGTLKKPGRPRKPRYDPSDPDSKEQYKRKAIRALLVWFKDQALGRSYILQLVTEAPRRNYFEGVDFRFPGLPVRRFDELFELMYPTSALCALTTDMRIEFLLLWFRRWLYEALPDAIMRNEVLNALQIQLDSGLI